MRIRATVTLDDDAIERVKEESRRRGASFRDTLNDLLRAALAAQATAPVKRTLKIKPRNLGVLPSLNYDDIEALIEYAEGPDHR